MIPAGKLTELIRIERAQRSVGAAGAVTHAWTPVATVRAERLGAATAEASNQNGTAATSTATFRLRYRADITTADRVVCAGRTFSIVSVSEIGRRIGIEIQCAA